MQELTFETILRLPQMELKKMLKAELKSRGYPVTDKPGYLYAEGAIPVLLMQFQQKGLPFYLYEFPRRVTNYRFQILFSRSISRFLYSAIR